MSINRPSYAKRWDPRKSKDGMYNYRKSDLINRQKTFANYPDGKDCFEHSIEEIAESGLYYTNHKDKFSCFMCGLKVKKQQIDDSVHVDILHHRESPSCPHLIHIWGTFIKDLEQDTPPYMKRWDHLTTYEGTYDNSQSQLQDRIDSFLANSNWNDFKYSQSADMMQDLASSGLFLQDQEIRCFKCGVLLKFKEIQDCMDIDFLHFEKSNKCPYIEEKSGDYIRLMNSVF